MAKAHSYLAARTVTGAHTLTRDASPSVLASPDPKRVAAFPYSHLHNAESLTPGSHVMIDPPVSHTLFPSKALVLIPNPQRQLPIPSRPHLICPSA
jgi:hypothetical protein